jgi:hypothetical protein
MLCFAKSSLSKITQERYCNKVGYTASLKLSGTKYSPMLVLKKLGTLFSV